MWFRSCSIPCSIALAALLAQSCSSAGRTGGAARAGVERIWDFQGSIFCQGRLVENGDQAEAWERTERSAFAHYCREGEPTTDLRETIRFVIPRAPADIPVDEAARGRQRLLSQVRRILRVFYSVASVGSGGDRAGARSCGVDSDTSPYFYGLSDAARRSDPLESLLRKDSSLPAWDDLGSYLFVRASRGSSLIYLTRNRAMRFEIPGENAPLAGGSLYSLADGKLGRPFATHWPGRGTLVASTGPVWFRVGGDAREPSEIFPLRQMSLGDAAVLRRLFTLAVPAEVQEKELGAAGIGLNPDGSFRISSLVRDRDAIWDWYFSRYTRVREGVNEDPRVIDFEVSLDLGLFCRYGRPVRDFVTR